MTTRKSGFFALALMTAVLAACESDEPIVPAPPVEVEVVPAAIQVDSGSTGTLVAVVRNATNTAVTWASSNQAVATVNASGVVTGVKPGQATITATSAESAAAIGAATVTVTRPAGQGTGQDPVISIRSVTQGSTNNPVAVNNVQGQIDVTVDFELRGAPVSRLEVLVDQTVACSQSFSTSGSVEANGEAGLTIVCSINTAEVNAQGVPRFPNGPHTVSARLVGTTGTVAANSSTNLTFANLDQLQVSATASGATANDQGGFVWATGDVTATATPAIFSGAANGVARVTFTVRDAATDAILATLADSTAPFSVTFPRTATTSNVGANVAGVEQAIIVRATSVTSAGQPGPDGVRGTAAQPALRLDNAAPDAEGADVASAIIMPQTAACVAAPPNADVNNCNWFGISTSLAPADRISDYATSLDDEGVNRNTVEWQYNTNLAATNNSTGWTTFTAVGELPQTTTTAGFRVRARVCDALNNCATVLSPASAAGTAGGDAAAPSISDLTTAPDSIDETVGDVAPELTIGSTENLSGFPGNFVQVRMIRTTYTGTAISTRCITDLAAGTDAAVPTAGCAFVAQAGTDINVPGGAGNGYFEVTVRTTDVAGNRSETITKSFLVDNTAPTVAVSGLTFTANNVTVSGTVADNLDLGRWDTRLQFGAGGTELPFTATTAAGSFGLPMTNSVAASGTAPIVRQLDAVNLSGVGFGAIDIANNFGSNYIGFAQVGNGITGTAIAAFGAPTIPASQQNLCRSGVGSVSCLDGANPDVTATSANITATVQTAANTTNPIAAVYFFVQVPAANGGTYNLLIGSDNSADLQIVAPANDRNWNYTATLPVSILPTVLNPGVGNSYTANVFAVAVDADGDAISTAPTAVTVY